MVIKRIGRLVDGKNKEDRIILSVVNTLFTVSLITMFTALLGTTLDGLIISRFLSEKSFAAFGLTAPLVNLIELLGSVIATGCVVACSHLISAGEARKANHCFTSSFTLNLLAGGFLALLLFFFPQISSVLVASANGSEFLPLMYQYIRGMAFAIPFIILNTLLSSIVQLDGDEKRVLTSSYVIFGVNLAGDFLVVTATDWGLAGVGATTTISYICGALVLLNHFRVHESIFKPGLSITGLKQTLPLGLPAVYSRAATMLRNYTYNLLALQAGGPVGIVAWSAVNNLSAFLSGFPKAIGQESLLGSGVFYGERDGDSLRRFMRCTVRLALMVFAVIFLLGLFLAPLLIRLYIPASSDAYREAVSGLRWYMLGMLPYMLNMIMSSYLQSAKKTAATRIINFMDGFGMLVLYALFLLRAIGFRGLWLSFFFGKSTVLLVSLLIICLRRKKIRLTMNDLLILPENFDVPEKDQFLATITCREDAVNISEKIIAYCLEKDFDRRRSSFVGLALEEMSILIIQEGFGDGKPHSIDLKLFVKENRLTVRLRDDCRAFDVNKRIDIMNPKDQSSNVGIRILNHIARDSEYYSVLEMNYLIMHI